MSSYTRIVGAVLRKPGLVLELVAASWTFRARGWYRRFPFLPLPPRTYLDWRMETAYGDPDAVPPPEELARFLRWARRMRSRME